MCVLRAVHFEWRRLHQRRHRRQLRRADEPAAVALLAAMPTTTASRSLSLLFGLHFSFLRTSFEPSWPPPSSLSLILILIRLPSNFALALSARLLLGYLCSLAAVLLVAAYHFSIDANSALALLSCKTNNKKRPTQKHYIPFLSASHFRLRSLSLSPASSLLLSINSRPNSKQNRVC